MFVPKSLRRAVFVLALTAVLISACSIGGAAPEPTVDINAINTAAVETAMGVLAAQFTQTAQAAPTATTLPTNTALPLPTFPNTTPIAGTVPTTSGALPTVSFNSTATTPLPGFTQIASQAAPAVTSSLGDACDNNQFVSDVTIPDNTVLPPGENFDKVWSVKNTGSCTWDDGYVLVYIGGSSPNLDPYNFEFKDKDDWVVSGETTELGLTLTTPCTPGDYQGTWRMRNDKGYYFGTPLTVVVKVTDKC
jgi:hypothetical protein